MEVRICEQLDIHRQSIVLPQQHTTALPSTGKIAKDRKCKLSERRTRLDHAHEQRYNARLRRLLLSTLVQTTKVVARLEYMIRHFLETNICIVINRGTEGEIVVTYRAVESGALLVKNPRQNLDGIGVLQNLEQRRIHREMFDGLEHMNEILRLKEFTCAQQPYTFSQPRKKKGVSREKYERRTTFRVPSALRTWISDCDT